MPTGQSSSGNARLLPAEGVAQVLQGARDNRLRLRSARLQGPG